MPNIASISGIAVADIGKFSGRAASTVAAVGGLTQASGPGFKTTDLEIWWRAEEGPMNNPSLIGSGIDIENLANTNGYASASIQGDHRLLNGSSSNWTTVGGVDAILLDGVNDNILTRQLYLGTNHSANDPFNDNLGASNIYYNQWSTLDSYATEVWVKAFNTNGSWSSGSNIFSAYMNDGFRMRLSGSSGQITFPSVQNTSNQQGSYTPSPAVYVGQDTDWHQICFVVDDVNGTMKTYIDGSLEDTRNFNIGFDSWIRNTMLIGAYRTSGSEAKKYYVGEYRMYKSKLSDSEVLSNYNGRKTHYGIT